MKDTIEIQIFLSSPKDVAPEKNIIKEVISSKNSVNTEADTKYRFAALDYRDLVFCLDGNIQTVINSRMNEYDIYIGILWMRFGTKTGNQDPHTGRNYESGTEEEFYIAKRKKEEEQILDYYFFFKKSKEFDTDDRESLGQLDKILEFKEIVKKLGAVERIENDSNTVPFTNRIHAILDLAVLNLEKNKVKEIKDEFIREANTKSGSIALAVAPFIEKSIPLPKSVHRTISPLATADPDFRLFHDGLPVRTLISETIEQPYILLLGNAGSGKSVELSKLADHYAEKDSPLVPVFQRMNTYIDETIEIFLPKGWKDIPEEIMLVILDGLDEVSPDHFNTAIKRIINFKQQYPKIRFVISCRTNFYDFQPDGSGPLNGFSIYFFDEIRSGSVDDYLQSAYGISADLFRDEIDRKGYQDLLVQPFFLNILATTYKNKYVLPANKADVLNGFIEQRLSFDEQHFKLSRDLGKEKTHIFQLLKRLALVMEDLGRNYLTSSELEKVLTQAKDIELVKCSTAFQKFIAEADKWGFEHNNIQEFLAASAISSLSTDEIKEFLTFDGTKIKPSWMNTLFFLMSIVHDTIRKELIAWILDSDPEILARIEPDRVDPAIRLEIFKNIFNTYKTRQIWLRSNKFTNRELANFAPVAPANEFLLGEILDKQAPRISRLSAVELLMYQQLDGDLFVRTKEALISLTRELHDDEYAFNAIANSLAFLNAVSDKEIAEFMQDFGKRNNQYIRAGMYQMITQAGLVDSYIDYFVSGIGLDDEMPDRDKTNLIDESLLLENAIRGQLSLASVIKLLHFFSNPTDRRLLTYYSKNEVYKHLMELSATYFAEHHELFDLIYKAFIGFGKYHEEGLAKLSCIFFTLTNTRLDAFKKILEELGSDEYYIAVLYKHLVNTTIIDYIMDEYEKRNLTNEDLKTLYSQFKWTSSTENATVLEYFKEVLQENTNILDNEIEVNHLEKNKIAAKVNLGLYFSVEATRQEINEFFITQKITAIGWDALWVIRKDNYTSNASIKDIVFDVLGDFTRRGKIVSKSEIDEFLDNRVDAERYLFESLKHKLQSLPDFQPEPEQVKILKEWIDNEMERNDIPSAISVGGESRNQFSYNKVVTACWYFISRFNIQIDKTKLLDYTLFDEPNSNLDVSLNFRVITNQVDREKVNDRVLSNLVGNIDVDSVWANNALYALDNGLRNANSSILRELANPVRSLNTRSHVMRRYLDQTEDFKGIFDILNPEGQDELSWEIMEQLVNKNVLNTQVIEKLLPVLDNVDFDEDAKFKAARLLTRLQDEMGTELYLNLLSAQKPSEFDFYGQTLVMRSISDSIFIPKLLGLLKLSTSDKYTKDAFNRLDRLVVDALYNIALSRETSLKAVTKALEEFISDNVGLSDAIMFYHTVIEKMKFDFYLAQSKNRTITESIERANSIQIEN